MDVKSGLRKAQQQPDSGNGIGQYDTSSHKHLLFNQYTDHYPESTPNWIQKMEDMSVDKVSGHFENATATWIDESGSSGSNGTEKNIYAFNLVSVVFRSYYKIK